MKIAITGASGFLGSYLVNYLIKNDHTLYLFTRSLGKMGRNKYSNNNIHLFETDYSFESLGEIFLPFDAMVHLGSKRYNPGQKMVSDYRINIDVSKNLFRVCEKNKIKNIIFTSTSGIYTSINELPFAEDQTVLPDNPYASSKLKIEELSNSYNINCKSLRIAQLVGWGEREGFMFKTFLNQAMKMGELTVFGEGKGKRDYLYVKDAVLAIERAINYPLIKGVFNVGSGCSTSHFEFAKLISRVFSNNLSKVCCDRGKKEDNSHFLLNIDKAKQIFKWVPRYSLENAFEDMKRDHEKNNNIWN